jgi:hypothetical protein
MLTLSACGGSETTTTTTAAPEETTTEAPEETTTEATEAEETGIAAGRFEITIPARKILKLILSSMAMAHTMPSSSVVVL